MNAQPLLFDPPVLSPLRVGRFKFLRPAIELFGKFQQLNTAWIIQR